MAGGSTNYLSRLAYSSSNYWEAAVTRQSLNNKAILKQKMRFKESHRPVTKYPIKNIMRKNRFIMTKEEYEACCKIARGYRAYRFRKDIDLII